MDQAFLEHFLSHPLTTTIEELHQCERCRQQMELVRALPQEEIEALLAGDTEAMRAEITRIEQRFSTQTAENSEHMKHYDDTFHKPFVQALDEWVQQQRTRKSSQFQDES